MITTMISSFSMWLEVSTECSYEQPKTTCWGSNFEMLSTHKVLLKTKSTNF